MKKTQKREGTRKRVPSKPERVVGGVIMPEIDSDLISSLRRMGAITPSEVATVLGLRISVAKDLLRILEKRGLIRLVAGNRSIRIYTISASAPSA
ncbi:MAG: hypothetical protein ACE5OY_04050 [Candidatus Bathyarchaeia archaeon]